MKKILVIGLLFLVSACSRCEDCCYSAPTQDCCAPVQMVREPVQRTVYKTVYEPKNYDSEACERKVYKTNDCTPDTYYERRQVVRRQPVVYQQKTYKVENRCSSSSCCGCQAPASEPKKMTCECSFK